MNKLFISQSNYIPWKGFFDAINLADTYVIYDTVQYTNRDWRNRNYLKTANGLQWLTIPVRVNSRDQKINETLINDDRWSWKHWKSIETNYSKSQYFNEYAPVFENLYKELKKEKNLSLVNFQLIKKICEILEISTELRRASEFEISGDKNERLINFCKLLNATTYYSGPSAQNYLSVEEFEKSGIEVKWIDYSSYPEYSQLYPPFEHSVTILDLIFNEGPKAREFMKSF